MKKTSAILSVLLTTLVLLSISIPQDKVQATLSTSSTSDPIGDLYLYQSGLSASTWSVIDIIYAEVSQINSTHIRLIIRASSTIPLTNQWQGYQWLLNTGISAPSSSPFNPYDINDLTDIAYAVSVCWAANGPLAIRITKYDGTIILSEDARNNPEMYFNGDACSITIPLNWIGNPTSIKWVAGSTDGVGSSSGRHDKAPNTGHVTLTLVVPNLVLTPTHGFAATTAVGTGFASDSKIIISWDGTNVPTVPIALFTDAYGNFSTIISIPTQESPGVHTVKATDGSGNSATTTFSVTDMTGPQGPQGPKGDKGDTGDTGPQGSSGVAPEELQLQLLVNGLTIAVSIISICLATIALRKKP